MQLLRERQGNLRAGAFLTDSKRNPATEEAPAYRANIVNYVRWRA